MGAASSTQSNLGYICVCVCTLMHMCVKGGNSTSCHWMFQRSTIKQGVTVLYVNYGFFVNSCNQICTLHWKCVPMRVTILAVTIKRNSKTPVHQIYPTVTQDFW